LFSGLGFISGLFLLVSSFQKFWVVLKSVGVYPFQGSESTLDVPPPVGVATPSKGGSDVLFEGTSTFRVEIPALKGAVMLPLN
jgi:hypothetical protein